MYQKIWNDLDPKAYGHYTLQAEQIHGRPYFKKIQLYYDSDPDSEDEDTNYHKDVDKGDFYRFKDLAIWSDGHEKWFIGEPSFLKKYRELPYSCHYNLKTPYRHSNTAVQCTEYSFFS